MPRNLMLMGMPRNWAWTVMLAVFGVLCLPVALGFTRLPGSLADDPQFYGRTAAGCLALGCLVAAVGESLPDRLDGTIVEQWGLRVMAMGAGLYVFALATVSEPTNALLAIGAVSGIGAGAEVHWWTLRRWRINFKRYVGEIGRHRYRETRDRGE